MNHDTIQHTRHIGGQLLQAGRYEEARVLLAELHRLCPHDTELMLQLALAERFLKRWPQAIALLTKATALAPENVLYAEQLATVLMFSNDGARMAQAIAEYARVLSLRPAYEVAANLLILALRSDRPQSVLDAIAPLLKDATLTDAARLHYASACAIAAYLKNHTAACEAYITQALAVRHAAYDDHGKPIRGDLYFMLVYVEFLQQLLHARAAYPALYEAQEREQTLHVVGESHCLTAAHTRLACHTGIYRVEPHLIMGAKAYFFGTQQQNSWQYTLESILRQAADTPVAVGFGELDCRPREGLMVQYRADPNYNMSAAIEALCGTYVAWVQRVSTDRTARTYIVGVPAPNRVVATDLAPGEIPVFLAMIREMNDTLRRETTRHELGFVDLYGATAHADGWAQHGMHSDNVHLTPQVVCAAFTQSLQAEA